MNRNHCTAAALFVAGFMLFELYTVLQRIGNCYYDNLRYNSKPCPEGKDQSVLCNCTQFKFAIGGLGVGMGFLIFIYERHKGQAIWVPLYSIDRHVGRIYRLATRSIA